MPVIKTTVVGSYPVPTWLRVFSTRESLRDAMLAVLKTQELAGIDVVADGELYRWDINHAETNGMIDYFVRPLDGHRAGADRRSNSSLAQSAGTAVSIGAAGDRRRPARRRPAESRTRLSALSRPDEPPKKFTVTSPYMLAKTVGDEHYGDLEQLVLALAEVLHAQVRAIDAEVVQVDEANVTGHPDDGPIAAAGINRVLEGVRREKAVHLCYGNYGGQTIQKGTYERLLEFLNLLQLRPPGAGDRPAAGARAGVAEGACGRRLAWASA